MLQRHSYPSSSPLPRLSLSCRQCLVIYSVVCCDCFFLGSWSRLHFFPLRSITLRYDGCRLAKHQHLRFRLAKWRVILCTSELSFILSEIVTPLVCSPKSASTWTLSCCHHAWLPLNGGFQKSFRVIYTGRACLLVGSCEERSAPPLPVKLAFSFLPLSFWTGDRQLAYFCK